jgi:hypothetical protein
MTTENTNPNATQIIEGGFYVFPVAADQEGGQ